MLYCPILLYLQYLPYLLVFCGENNKRQLENRMAGLFEKATTAECRAKIGEHFSYFINAIGKEAPMPFANARFTNQCNETKYDFDDLPPNISIAEIQNKSYQPPKEEAAYIDDPENLKLCYGVMTHANPNATIRLVEALYEVGHSFIIHVDAKENSADTYNALVEYASSRDFIHILDDPFRVRVNWGGFSMVNATLQILRYAFAVDRPHMAPLDFHKFVHMAATSYPIVSNTQIRRRIASYPLDANMFSVVLKGMNPSPDVWQYFVECDDAMHRIYRLPPLTEGRSGVDLYTASQWFVLSREFAKYLADPLPGTFVFDFLPSVEHVAIADETFFGTVLMNTPFCHKHHNDNFLHLQFDRWVFFLKHSSFYPF
jgi:hypothetical protein